MRIQLDLQEKTAEAEAAPIELAEFVTTLLGPAPAPPDGNRRVVRVEPQNDGVRDGHDGDGSLSINEVAELANVSPAVVYRAVQNGELRARKSDRRWSVTRAAAQTFASQYE